MSFFIYIAKVSNSNTMQSLVLIFSNLKKKNEIKI